MVSFDPTTDTAAQRENVTTSTYPGTDYPDALALGYSPDNDLMGSVVGIWPHQEDSGTTVNDTSGNGNDGTYNGFTLNNTPGISGFSYADHDATNDYWVTNSTITCNGSQATILLWHYFTDTASQSYARLMRGRTSNDPSQNSGDGWYLQRDGGDPRFECRTNAGGLLARNNNIDLTIGQWYCHVIRLNGTNGSYYIYDDTGSEIQTATASSSRVQNPAYLIVGGGDGRYEGGRYGPVIAMSNELSDGEVQTLVNMPL